MFGKNAVPTKQLLLTTTMTLVHPYEELGLVWSYMGNIQYEQAMEALRKETLKRYPEADAVIGIVLAQKGIGFGLMGTAVRYTTERTESWRPSQSET
jgi:hypothetical protein